jgi:hypothetical protein
VLIPILMALGLPAVPKRGNEAAEDEAAAAETGKAGD